MDCLPLRELSACSFVEELSSVVIAIHLSTYMCSASIPGRKSVPVVYVSGWHKGERVYTKTDTSCLLNGSLSVESSLADGDSVQLEYFVKEQQTSEEIGFVHVYPVLGRRGLA